METKQNENRQPEERELEEQQLGEQKPEEQRSETKPGEAEEQKVPARPEESLPESGGKKAAGKGLKSDRFKRGGMATIMSVVFIAIVVAVNILAGALTDRFPSMNIDLTADKLNTLSEKAEEIARGIGQETRIYLIGEKDAYHKNQVYASYNSNYGVRMDSSQVANLAEKLQETNSKIKVEYVDPDTNPTFINKYPNDRLVTGTVLVETDKRHKVLAVSDMFSVQSGNSGYQVYSKVDNTLAAALEMVNLDKVPVVAIATGHNEMLSSSSMASFVNALENENFQVEEVNFLTDELPEDTQLLMLPTPTTDYTQEELQRIRDYLEDTSRDERLSLLVTCYPAQGDLPNLKGFLEEWGVKVEDGVVAETDSSRVALASPSYVLVDATENVLTEDYGTLIAAQSSPLTLLFEGNGDVSTMPLWTTADTAYAVTEEMTEEESQSPVTGAMHTATLSVEYVKYDTKNVMRSVAVFGSSHVFTDTFMNASAFGDRNYVIDLMKYMTGTDGSAVSVYVEQVQTNVMDVSASQSTVVLLGLGVFTIGIPLAILIAGLVIFLKRRHL